MNLYSFRNLLTGNGAVWLKLNTLDLENMVQKTVAHKPLQLNGKNVLDLGCGTGNMLSYLHREEKCIPYGVDLIRLNIHQCRKKMENGNFSRKDIVRYLDIYVDIFRYCLLFLDIGRYW